MINIALKTIRSFHGLTQAELAKQLELSKSYLSEIEAGDKTVSFKLLQKYSSIFDIPVSSLVFFAENVEREGELPKKFRRAFSGKVLMMLDWVAIKNDARNAKT